MTGVELAIVLVLALIRWIYRSLTGASERERQREHEEDLRWRAQLWEWECQDQARRKVIEDAKSLFEQAVMGSRFPADEVLAILADCDSDIPASPKEAVEELVYGRCSLHSMTFSHAVRLIQQRQRTADRARKRREEGSGEPTGPVTQSEAYDLLGVAPGCSPEELASAYHRKVLQWHPDKLSETMAQELRDYATRHTARINEAFQKLRPRAS